MESIISNYASNVNELVRAFVSDVSTTAEDRTTLISFLNARPIRLASVTSSFIDNPEQRINFARELGQFAAREGIDISEPSFFWAFLMIASLDRFSSGNDASRRESVFRLKLMVGHISILLKTCKFNIYSLPPCLATSQADALTSHLLQS